MRRAGSLAILLLLASVALAQSVTSFDGVDTSQVAKPEYDVDPNGAIGTKQFMEYVNLYYQAYDKVTFAPVWSTPQPVSAPFTKNGLNACASISGDGMIIFDRLASRWVLAGHTGVENNYLYCIAISNTDDLSSPSLAWYTYSIALAPILGKNAEGNVYFPDWPKIATWPNAYYVGIDLNDINQNYREVGVVACALDRTNMLINGTPNPPQCFEVKSPLSDGIYLGHSLIPADVDGTIPPPSGRDEYMVSIQNPTIDGSTTTSNAFNLWDFHLNWTNPALSTFTQSTVSVASYTPGCYDVKSPVQTVCVPEPSTSSTKESIDSVGDRFMPRFAYRNFGTYESFLVSHDVQPGSSQQTGIRWYELRGSGTPTVYQDGTISPDKTTYRFIPSIAEDSSGNAAVGYSVSSAQTHPGMNASWWSLTDASAPQEFTLYDGAADQENTWHWGSYDSMTVDPVDGCTFWYVNEYYPQNQTGTEIIWHTRISNFELPGCGQSSGITLSPTSLSLGSMGVGSTSPAQQVTLTNNSGSALTINSIAFSGGNPANFGQTNTCGTSVANGASCTLNVTFTPNATGAFSSTLEITDSASNSPQAVSVAGTGVTAVTLSRTSLSFGTVFIGSSVTAPAITLTNNQSVALTGISISVNSSSYSQVNTCGTSIGPGAKCTITVTFSPKSAGALTGTVTISDSGSNSPQSISLQGNGKQPVTFSPATMSFGTATVGNTTGSKNETLTNTQNTTLTFSSITITGKDPTDFNITGNTCGSATGAQSECIVSVDFAPKAKGARTATLQFTDSAGTSPQTVNLAGTGQ
ncbi:MAG TPA: choice-of-anchor D domain-containing protein [Candidatus Sulfotelmatobacter sp.]